MERIIMPKAGMAMEEGKIIKWLVQEGDTVTKGDTILEIETDKVSMEVEASASGTVVKITAQAGDTVPVTHTIGYIGKPGEAIPAEEQKAEKAESMPQAKAEAQRTQSPLKSGTKIAATPLAKTLAKERHIDLASVTPTGFLGEIKAKDVLTAGNIKATPLARKMAEAAGIQLKDVKPEGKRIYSSDIEDIINKAKDKQKNIPAAMDGDIVKPLNGMRRTIAQRMFNSHIEVPPVTMDTKANVTGLLMERKSQNAKGGVKISINDYVIEACAMALAAMPEANVSYAGDSLVYRKHVNIGIAVALESGLVVPVIKDTDRLSLEEISQSAKALAEKARSGKLMPDEYTGGTFTISNLGMYGITAFTPIINQPESLILGVCAVEKVLCMDEAGKLFNKDIMGLSLTFDHRAHDGASAAVFLKKVVENLERFNAQG